MLQRLHGLKDLQDLTQPAVTDITKRGILQAKGSRNRMENAGGGARNRRPADSAVASGSSSQISSGVSPAGGDASEASYSATKGRRLFG